MSDSIKEFGVACNLKLLLIFMCYLDVCLILMQHEGQEYDTMPHSLSHEVIKSNTAPLVQEVEVGDGAFLENFCRE